MIFIKYFIFSFKILITLKNNIKLDDIFNKITDNNDNLKKNRNIIKTIKFINNKEIIKNIKQPDKKPVSYLLLSIIDLINSESIKPLVI